MAKSDLTAGVREVYEALGRDIAGRKDFSSDGAYGLYKAAKELDEYGKNDIRKAVYATVLKAAELEKDRSDIEANQRMKELHFTYEQLKQAQMNVSAGIVKAPEYDPANAMRPVEVEG